MLFLPFRIPTSALLAALLLLSGCDAVFGSKDDLITDEILEEGQTDPTLVDEVGYVPLTPFFTQGVNGPFENPSDVYVGYDEFVYVADDRGLHVLDLAGRPQFLLDQVEGQPLRDITAVTQGRDLDVFIAARRDTTVAGATCPSSGGGEQCDLAVVYRIGGLTTGAPIVKAKIWHPFSDASRALSGQFDEPDVYERQDGGTVVGTFSDEDAVFTGVATLADGRFYVTRRGPVNTLTRNGTGDGRPNLSFSPFNALLTFNAEGDYEQFIFALSPSQPGLLSAYYPSDVLTFLGPPQDFDEPLDRNFLIAQSPVEAPDSPQQPLRYGVVSILVVETSDGIEYRVDTERFAAGAAPDTPGGLYDDFQFGAPTSLAFAADATRYLFVADAVQDSLFVFNATGVEGVAPPPGETDPTPIRVSFGGTGGGALQFRNPQGVAYYDRIVYVADTGNGRISRYRLNTDFE
ncbi:MAG: hypothetical protein AAF089_13045 [Bacteroidota bacterium]